MTNNLFKITDGPGKKTSEIIQEMRSKFDVWMYSEENVDQDFPEPKKETVRYFKKTVEADEEHKNKSADDLKKEGIEGITLRERLLMEVDYFEETGKHLDVKNFTLCSGSRNSDGYVPLVRWSAVDREVCVDWSDPAGSSPSLRPRAVVSNPLTSDLVPSAIPVNNRMIQGHLDVIEKHVDLIKKLLK